MRTEDAYQGRGLARHVLTSGLDRLAAHRLLVVQGELHRRQRGRPPPLPRSRLRPEIDERTYRLDQVTPVEILSGCRVSPAVRASPYSVGRLGGSLRPQCEGLRIQGSSSVRRTSAFEGGCDDDDLCRRPPARRRRRLPRRIASDHPHRVLRRVGMAGRLRRRRLGDGARPRPGRRASLGQHVRRVDRAATPSDTGDAEPEASGDAVHERRPSKRPGQASTRSLSISAAGRGRPNR